jgi:glucose/arabinose dehydrogenase
MRLGLEPIVTNLALPTFLTSPRGDMHRFFVTEKGGSVVVVEGGSLLPTPFLDISALVSTGGEQGLLGLAFDPDYEVTGRFYVSYTDVAGTSTIARYLVSGTDPDLADASSAEVLLTIAQPFSNHNGGMLAFGPEGYLYISMGDGGGSGDPSGNGQDPTDLLGSLLRIDVSVASGYEIPPDNPFLGVPGAAPELWDLGLRNPWRFSFDRMLGDLYIGDVGQDLREEIDVATAPDAGMGVDWGWNIMEGELCFEPAMGCNTTGLVLPVHTYSHSGGACSVIGGYVYRGSAIRALDGHYLYGDYCAGWVKSFRLEGGQAVDHTTWSDLSTSQITSFGEDAAGELYVLSAGGSVSRIVEE